MPYSVERFPGTEATVLISLFEGVDKPALHNLKSKLVAGDKAYDFCFINSSFVISKELLFHSIYKAIYNFRAGSAKSKTLNTEILYNLSSVNNIAEAFRKFGVDDTKETDNLIAVKVFGSVPTEDELSAVNDHLVKILGVSASQNVELTDEKLLSFVDVAQFKKTYRLNDAKPFEETQQTLTKLAIGACTIRGN